MGDVPDIEDGGRVLGLLGLLLPDLLLFPLQRLQRITRRYQGLPLKKNLCSFVGFDSIRREARTRKSFPSPERGPAERRESTRLWFLFLSLNPISPNLYLVLKLLKNPTRHRSKRENQNQRREIFEAEGNVANRREGLMNRRYLAMARSCRGDRRRTRSRQGEGRTEEERVLPWAWGVFLMDCRCKFRAWPIKSYAHSTVSSTAFGRPSIVISSTLGQAHNCLCT